MPVAPRYRGRFAPSPTGPLHFGSLLTALGSWLIARRAGGEWWVRVEDLDPPREVPGAAEVQLRSLAAFGLVSDGPIVRQSDRHDRYRAALDRLLADGHAFACGCSRTALAAAGGIHRACVINATLGHMAVRLRVPDGATAAFDDALCGRVVQDVATEVGDFVLLRADGHWAYQLAVVVDDADQGITDVVRGADLLDSTPRQILLQRALGLPTPRHAHLPLLLGADGRKLSKSEAALPVSADDPPSTLHRLWHCLGQAPLPLERTQTTQGFLREAVAAFRLEQVPTQALPLSAAMHNANATPHA